MFLRKNDVIVKELSNVYGMAVDILVVGYDNNGVDHNKTKMEGLIICQKGNLKLNKYKMSFQVYEHPILWRDCIQK